MKRANIIGLPYSLHDAKVNNIQINGEDVVLNFSYGFFEAVDGDAMPVKKGAKVKISGADLDFCSVYLFESSGQIGNFTGEKMELTEFVSRFPSMDFEIIDETYGYNKSKFWGYIYIDEQIKECIIELYHFGDMEYIIK